jgi:hypothetical protein
MLIQPKCKPTNHDCSETVGQSMGDYGALYTVCHINTVYISDNLVNVFILHSYLCSLVDQLSPDIEA